MTLTYFQIRGWDKRWVEDSYDHGEIGEATYADGDDDFESVTLDGVFKQVLNFCDATWLDVYVDEDRVGVFTVGIMENRDGLKAGPSELSDWRRGLKKLYSAEYTFVVKKITSEDVVLNPEEIAGFSKEGK